MLILNDQIFLINLFWRHIRCGLHCGKCSDYFGYFLNKAPEIGFCLWFKKIFLTMLIKLSFNQVMKLFDNIFCILLHAYNTAKQNYGICQPILQIAKASFGPRVCVVLTDWTGCFVVMMYKVFRKNCVFSQFMATTPPSPTLL